MEYPFEKDKSLHAFTTFKVGGPARFFVEVQTLAQLQDVLSFCTRHHLRYFPLGKGSNTLFDDRGFDGVIILNKISFCEEKEGLFHVGAGYSFSLLGVQTARKGWEGLEFASGIPGSVGGAVYMNAGANGGETFQTLVEVTFVHADSSIEVFSKESLKAGYRFSLFQNLPGVIASAKFQLTPSASARQKQLQLVEYRTRTQPYGDPSAGCVFRNPEAGSAGALIEKCGLKGVRVGGAEVSTLHANFIINAGNASAQDILSLAELVQATVKEKTGIHLEMEVRKIAYES